MQRLAARILIPLALAGVLAAPAAGVRRQPHVKPKAAIEPVRWALRAVNFVETRATGTLGVASSVCPTQNWSRVDAETKTLKDYLLAAEPSRRGLVVQSNAVARLLRRFVKGSGVAHLHRAKSQLLASSLDHRTSFEALRDGADALTAHDCETARAAWTTAGQQAVAGQDEARQGLLELRAAGFKYVDPDWAYE